jgi:hypothetical protein
MNNKLAIKEKLYEPLCLKIPVNKWTQFDSNVEKEYKNLSFLIGTMPYFTIDMGSEIYCGVLAKFIQEIAIKYGYRLEIISKNRFYFT